MSAEKTINTLKQKIFEVTPPNFESLALEIFRFQYENNPVYHQYVNILKRDIDAIQTLADIPFMPISFFKTHKVVTAENTPQKIFESSGTTGQLTSKHYIHDLGLYEASFMQCFETFFGNISHYCILGLLPSYLERNNSSLVYMVNHLITKSQHPQSRFYLNEYDTLQQVMHQLEEKQQRYILFGVTFALLDFSEKFPLPVSCGTIVETGGMKGRGKELIRAQLHETLQQRFNTENITSEYGMTELLSQAYMQPNHSFQSPPWMKILIRDIYNPFHYLEANQSGAINVIDLANIHSCSFIETADIGKLNADNSFEVLGRIDTSEVRGCNLLVA
jgi:phenylacetate-coenzyme A ligase PaaK-like adenylate-forming protein